MAGRRNRNTSKKGMVELVLRTDVVIRGTRYEKGSIIEVSEEFYSRAFEGHGIADFKEVHDIVQEAEKQVAAARRVAEARIAAARSGEDPDEAEARVREEMGEASAPPKEPENEGGQGGGSE